METSIFRLTRPGKSFWDRAWPYELALAVSAVAFGLTLLLLPWLNFSPRLLLYGAIIVTSRFAGAGPGIVATFLTGLLAHFFVMPLRNTADDPTGQWMMLGSFLAISLLTVGIVAQLRSRAMVLREKEDQLTDFMENATVGLQWLAEDGTILWSNRAAQEILGFTTAAGGEKFQDYCLDAATGNAVLHRLAHGERLKNYEIALRARDGSTRAVLLDANVLWKEGRYVHARCFLRDITQRKRAEEELARERNLLRTLIDALPDYIYTKDRDGRFQICNIANVRLLGAQSESDIRGKSVLDLCPPEAGRRFAEDDRAVIDTGRVLVDREEPFPDARRGERTLLTTKLPLRDASGEVNGLVGISRDITDYKRADEALRKSEASLRLAQRIGRIGSWEVDLRTECIEWSEETYRIFGCNPVEFAPTGPAFFAMVHPDDREAIRRTSEHAKKHGEYYSVDYRIFRPDGSERFVVQQARIVRDAAGQALRLVGTLQDITERKQTEMALRDSELRYRQLVQALPGAVYTCDLEGRITLYNEAAAALWGRRPEIGRDMWCGSWRIYDAQGAPITLNQCPMARAIREGRPVRGVEIIIERPDGTRSQVLPHPDPIRDSSGAIVGGVNMLVDVTEHKKAEEAIRRLNEELEARVQERTRQLEQANRELEAFSYSISHDLRAPVRAIGGFARIIEEEHLHRLDDEGRRLFKIIADSARRMDTLINDLLAFSRLNAHELTAAPVDMTGLAQSVIAEQTNLHHAGLAEIRLDELPEITGDESLLRQVLTNLISNALKFSRHAARPVVEVGGRRERARQVFYVRDNGEGFDMRYASKLFKVFQRLHNVEKYEGTGVGLAIVQRIIQRHGGEVWAESSPGKGATFYFSLPAVAEAASPATDSPGIETISA